jgi:biopolymer transport protein ExbD
MQRAEKGIMVKVFAYGLFMPLHLSNKPNIMAEINVPNSKATPGARRSKKLSTKVDLTPMVDLGFLLITFFVFTTSLHTPMAMHLNLPDDSDTKSPIETAASKTISFLLGANNKVYYYNGDSVQYMHATNFSATGLRNIINTKKAMVQHKYGDANETVVLIKPTENATYANIIDALDEMQISMVNRYVLMDADANEMLALHTMQ